VFYSISQRRNEIGIRTALGATPGQLFRLVLAESARVAAVGAGLGLIAASLLTPMAASIFVGIGASDPAVLVGVAITCAATTVAIALMVIRPWTRLPPSVLLQQQDAGALR
jgi:ABC-type antimicrobial peptide transport system permease subunit